MSMCQPVYFELCQDLGIVGGTLPYEESRASRGQIDWRGFS